MDAREVQGVGLGREIERFDVLFPTPKERLLELVEPTKFTAKLDEPVVTVDPTTGQKSEQLPSYNAYSIDGDVTAPLVYVNYGRVEDYEQLERMGVSVRGAIVIVRYGQNFRGVKSKIAFEHGAVGCLIYSDPKDDGYFGGRGVSGRTDAAERRRAARIGRRSRDGIRRSADDRRRRRAWARRRTPINESPILTKIPVLPISYGDAQPLLAAIDRPDGARAPGAARCRFRIASAPGARRRCTSRSRSTGTRSRSTTSSRRFRDRRSRMNGSSAATTTTPG